MKRFLRFLVSEQDVGTAAFARALAVVPSDNRVYLSTRLSDRSPKCAELLRVLEESGCRPRSDFESTRLGTFSCFPNYEYEPEDLARAEYFTLMPSTQIHLHMGRDDTGKLMLPKPKSNWKSPLLSTNSDPMVASSPFRATIEQAGLIGAAFGPTRLMAVASWRERKYVDWSELGWSPYWELSSTILLPPISPRCVLFDSRGNRVSSDNWQNGMHLREGEFPAGELHYAREAIRALEPFDVAKTYEAFGNKPNALDHRRLVVSRRAREFMLSHGIKAAWWPVVLDEHD